MYEDELELMELEDLEFEDEYELGEFEDEYELGEFEDEYELGEFEDEYELGEFEDEYELGEFEDEYELGEFEDEYELGEFEGDMLFGGIKKFFKKAVRTVKKVARNPVFRRVLKGVARTAGPLVAGAIGGPAAAAAARWAAKRFIREAEMEAEYESEAEFEYEFEMEGGDLEALAEMEALAQCAAKTNNPAKANKCIKKMAHKAAKMVPPSTPNAGQVKRSVAKGVVACSKVLQSTPRTKKLIPVVPTIAAKTAVSAKRLAKTGRTPTKKRVAQIMARHTTKSLATPRKVSKAVRRSKIRARRSSIRVVGAPRRRTYRRYPSLAR